MTLWRKTLLLVAIAVGALIAIIYGLSYRIVLKSFEELERAEATKNVERALDALGDAIDHIRTSAQDYARWDQTVAYIEGGGAEYERENLNPEIIANLRCDVWVLSHRTAGVRAALDLRGAPGAAPPAEVLRMAGPGGALLAHASPTSSFTGVLLLPGRPLLVVSQPIIRTDGSGPVAGALIAARTLDAAEVDRLAKLVHLSLEVYVFGEEDRPPDVQDAAAALATSEERVHLRPLSDERIAGYAIVHDIDKRPALVVRVDMPRDIYRHGQASIRYLMLALFVAGGVFAGLTLLVLDRLVLGRLARLSGEVRVVEQSGDLTTRVTVTGTDELSQLGTDVNAMLTALERSREKEQAYLREIEVEKQKSERLLLNILPGPIADRLKAGSSTIADSFPEVTVLFADLVGFTSLSAKVTPLALVEKLNAIFSAFDALAERFGLEKIKTIGDCYMVVGGLPKPRPDHAQALADMAIAMLQVIADLAQGDADAWDVRIGMNTGPVVAGVIGTKKFIYDLWGDAVNSASRMESTGAPGRIHVTEATYKKLEAEFILEPRGTIQVKGKGEMRTWFLNARKPAAS